MFHERPGFSDGEEDEEEAMIAFIGPAPDDLTVGGVFLIAAIISALVWARAKKK